MTITEFWTIVERVHVSSGGDMDTKCHLLAEELRHLPGEEVRSFARHFGDCFHRAYSHPLWDAAALICGGCGDDSFTDFRSTLISMGRSTFENAVANPDSLAETDLTGRSACYEGYQYVVYEILGKWGESESDHRDVPSHSRDISGLSVNEWEYSMHYPRLAEKFHHDDSKYLYVKERREKAKQRQQFAEYLGDLLLHASIVAPNGLIPPFRVLKQVLLCGRSPEQTGKTNTWEPIELKEEDYWTTVVLLEGMTADQIKAKGLNISKLKQDLNAPASDDFAVWFESVQT